MTLPTVQPTSTLAKVLMNGAKNLTNSVPWQAWCGVENVSTAIEAAGAFVWINEYDLAVEEETGKPRHPLALFYVGSHARRLVAAGTANVFQPDGRLRMLIEAEIPQPHLANRSDAYMWFLNQAGAVEVAMLAFAGVAGFLNITEMVSEDGPVLSDEAENMDHNSPRYCQIAYALEWSG